MAGIIGIVTTRGGIRGPHNIYTKNLAGTPLVAYTLRETDKSKHIQRTILTTDAKDVARAAGLYSAKVITRPAELSGEKTPLADIVRHALEELKTGEDCEPGVVVVLPAEFPIRRAAQIDEAIEKLEASGADSVMGVCPAEQSPYEMVRLDGDRAAAFIEETGKRQKAYRVSGALYVLKPSLLLEQGKLCGGDMRAVVTGLGDSTEVLNRTGFMKAEHILRDRKKDIFR